MHRYSHLFCWCVCLRQQWVSVTWHCKSNWVTWELWIIYFISLLVYFIQAWHVLTVYFCLRFCLYVGGHFIMRPVNLLFHSSLANLGFFLCFILSGESGWLCYSPRPHMQQFFNFTMHLTKLYTIRWFGNIPHNVCFSSQQSSLYGKLSLWWRNLENAAIVVHVWLIQSNYTT